MPRSSSDFYLADIIGCEILNLLDGLFSKSDCLLYLEKLIFRWNLLFRQVHLITPFVGHQYLKKDTLSQLWDWILNLADPESTTLLTRKNTFNRYKKVLEANGYDFNLLQKYKLENVIIRNYKSKQDFHAKFYAGVTSDCCEVLTGSFNLVNGPSFENALLKNYSFDEYNKKYLSLLNINVNFKSWPVRHYLIIAKNGDNWICNEIQNHGERLII